MTIETKKISTKYRISNGDKSILVKIFENGRMTIKTKDNEKGFYFVETMPENVMYMAELMFRAGGLAMGMNDENVLSKHIKVLKKFDKKKKVC